MNLEESANYILINQSRLADRFYEVLFREHPEVRVFFDGINMDAQRAKLVTALVTVQRQATVGGWVSENYLRDLGKMHVKLGVRPSMFRDFIETLMKVLAEFHDEHWTQDLANDWRHALNASVELMLTAYPSEDD